MVANVLPGRKAYVLATTYTLMKNVNCKYDVNTDDPTTSWGTFNDGTKRTCVQIKFNSDQFDKE